MPHSSGGGSHGGGSHSGSGFSSSSSSSSGESSARHVRTTSFPGARRYVYYHNYQPVYVYADYDIRKTTATGKFFSILGSAVMLLFGILLLAMCYEKPQKMAADPSYSCVIKDSAYVIDTPNKVQNAIERFYNKTGIPVEIMTVNNEDWQNDYSDLEDFAYDTYVSEFDDEKHWLIVYSEPTFPDADFNDWYWEGMQGDETDNILTQDSMDDFNELLQKYLTASSRYDVSSAIASAFNETTPHIMDGHIEWIFVLWGLIFVGIGGYEIYKTMLTNRKEFRSAVRCSESSKEDTCEYCGNVYVVGTCLQCHIHRAEVLTEEAHTAALIIAAAIPTAVRGEALVTQGAHTSQGQQDMYIIITTGLYMFMQIMT